MAQAIQFNISIGNLPAGWTGTPQELINQVAELLAITPDQAWSAFAVGAEEPTYNAGPWLKDGIEWYVWNDTLARYTPISEWSFKAGDVKLSYVSGDETAYGWFVLDGRTINAIPSISSRQVTALEAIFGVGAALPTKSDAAIFYKIYAGPA